MIQIDTLDRVGYRYHFPTIDFKFQNTGAATAFLWQFAINILYAEVDPKPELDFQVDVDNGDALIVHCTNFGWGTAQACQIKLDEPTLNQIFSQQKRQYTGTIQSEETKLICRLTQDAAIQDQLEKIHRTFVPFAQEAKNRSGLCHDESLDFDSAFGIKLENINAQWSCNDELGNNHNGIRVIQNNIVLAPQGFVYEKTKDRERSPEYSVAESDVTYITIIDPSQGTHHRTYPISRKIPSGDIERFHIMLGSPLSCKLRIQFKFFVDKATVVKSEEFDINIWNPRNSGWKYYYKDGSELSRQIETGCLSPRGYRQPSELQRVAADFPFNKIVAYDTSIKCNASGCKNYRNTEESFVQCYRCKKSWCPSHLRGRTQPKGYVCEECYIGLECPVCDKVISNISTKTVCRDCFAEYSKSDFAGGHWYKCKCGRMISGLGESKVAKCECGFICLI